MSDRCPRCHGPCREAIRTRPPTPWRAVVLAAAVVAFVVCFVLVTAGPVR